MTPFSPLGFRRWTLFLGLFLSGIYTGCKDDSVAPSSLPTYQAYFPIDSGTWIEYDADSVVHLPVDDAGEVDTAVESYHFQLREVIDSVFIDGEGDTAVRINRYRRDNDTLPWEYFNLWTAKRTSENVERTEDNIRFVKLAFPIDARKSWNGNAYNFFLEEVYIYRDLFQAKTVGPYAFDQTITVLQNEFSSNINRIYKEEIYARDVGMIRKQSDSVSVLIQSSGLPLILNGTEYTLTVRDYGH